MVDVIHEHESYNNTGGNVGTLVGVILIAAVILFLLYYFGQGLSYGGNSPQNNVPERVNIDINQGAK